MNSVKPGKFIVLEGADGSGKTTATPYLTDKLNSLGLKTISTREVGSTPIGGVLRNLAFNPREDEVLDPISRLLLVYAARIQNIKCIVEPALREGINVVCDRFSDSTFVYQGKMDGLNYLIKDFENIEELKYLGKRPDHLIFFDISAETSIGRSKTRGAVDNVQYKGNVERTEKIVAHYKERMQEMEFRKRGAFLRIDAEKDFSSVFEQLDVFALKLHAEQ